MDDTRIQKLIFAMGEVDGCFIENPVDLLYLTGLSLSRGRLWVTSNGAILFVDGRYYDRAKKEAPCPVAFSEEKGIEQELSKARRIGFDSAFVTYDRFLQSKNKYPLIDWVPIPNILRMARSRKSGSEREALRRAADLTLAGYHRVLGLLSEGISELEIALEFEMYCRKNGASGLSFESIIAFGENSAYPHHRAGKTKLQKNQIVLMDFGAVFDGYHADMTRIFFFGTPDPKLLFFEELVRRAQTQVISQIRPGVRVGKLDEIARAEFQKEGLENFFTHSLGHGVGLETHEYPLIRFDGLDKDTYLEEGMVIAIEPGLYQSGLGGVRLEDMVLVTENGHENFMQPIP